MKAHAEENFFGVDVGGDARVAEGSGEDGVEVAGEHGETVGRDGGFVFEVAVGSPVEVGERDGSAGGFDGFDGLRDDFFADAVAGDDGDFLVSSHG